MKILNFLKKYSLYLFGIYTTIIIIASLIPKYSKHYQSGEIADGILPKEGDNFKIANLPAVYRLEKGLYRQYLNDTSFFSYPENKEFNTPYTKGGILICDKSVLNNFKRGDYMPKYPGEIAKKYQGKTFWERMEQSAFRSDKFGHLGAYLVFAFLFMLALQELKISSKPLQISIVMGLGILLGGAIEWAQFQFVPGRDKELLDFLYNSLGLLLGVLIALRVSKI